MVPPLSCLTFIFQFFAQLQCHFDNGLILISNIPVFFCLFIFFLRFVYEVKCLAISLNKPRDKHLGLLYDGHSPPLFPFTCKTRLCLSWISPKDQSHMPVVEEKLLVVNKAENCETIL